MRMDLRAVWAGLAIAAALLGQAASSQSPFRPGGWQVDWGDRLCSLVRHPMGDQPTLVLRTIPGSRLWELTFIRRTWPNNLRGANPTVLVSLRPGEPEFQGQASTGTTPLGASISVQGLRLSFVERFAQAETISFGSGGQVYHIPIPQARQAVAAMRACEDDAMRQWGIDTAAFWQVSVPATGNMADFFHDTDYPWESIRSNGNGLTVVRVDIGADGRVVACDPVAGTNNPAFDNRACIILRNRATFSPARDANGTAIRSQLVVQIRWRTG